MWILEDELSLFLGIGLVKYANFGDDNSSDDSPPPSFPVKATEITKEWIEKTLHDSGVLPNGIHVTGINIDKNVGE